MNLLLSVGGQYYRDVRRSISILMNLSLALTFMQAPFLHVHQHEETQRHRGRFFHPEISDLDPDDDAIFQHWYSATFSDLSTPAFVPTFVYAFVPVTSSEPFLEPDILSGHDPPRLTCTSPRSPPV